MADRAKLNPKPWDSPPRKDGAGYCYLYYQEVSSVKKYFVKTKIGLIFWNVLAEY